VTVIGAGPGGYHAALRAARLGAQVRLVEADRVGGTCLNRGCIPTKALVASARALATARRLKEFGLAGDCHPRPDLAAVQARAQKVVQTQLQALERLISSHGIGLVPGRGRLSRTGGMVEVEGPDGEQRRLESDAVIIATGSAPAPLPGLEPDGEHILNSDHLLRLEELPASLAVVGGGVVGCELACIMSALGVEVTVVEALDRLLPIPSLEPEVSRLLAREFKKAGIKSHTGMVVEGWEASGGRVRLRLGPSPLVEHRRIPRPVELAVERVLVAVGRRLCSEDLGLEAAGVERDARGAVVVDDRLCTTRPDVYAVGDVLGPGRPMLAHLAAAEGELAAANALGADRSMDYRVVPAVAFTFPEVAWVGLSRAQAAERGLAASAHSFLFRALGQAHALGEIAGQATLVVEEGSERLLGAHLIGAHASEMIAACALALKLGATARQVAETICAHPTLSEAVQQAAAAALGECLYTLPPRA
jgi:dihydrolipoamide dehydrogenase